MKQEAINKNYNKVRRQRFIFMLIIAILLMLLLILGISMGAAKINLSDVFSALIKPAENNYFHIIFNIRLPRVLTAALAGMALSMSGAAMQSLLRNPLASPISLGISHAAAFGAAFAIVILGAGSSFSLPSDAVIIYQPYVVTISAFVFSLISTGTILLISKYKDASPETIVLSGIICGSLFTAGISVLQYFADDIQLSAIVFWLFGDLGKADWNDFLIMLLILIPTLFYFIKNRWNYNVLNAGDETAASLGVNVDKTRVWGMVLASLSSAVAVSLFGVIAFIGLVVPHIVRRFIGSDERFLIPASALFGAMFLLLSDIVARNLFSPVIIPVGIFTSFIGAPLFLYLLIKGIKKY
jgi:iron complex transport system permease protein